MSMKNLQRALLIVTLVAASVAGTHASAQAADPNAPLRAYAEKVLPRCPDGNVTVAPQSGNAPANFALFTVTVASSDQNCGTKKYLLYSKTSQQILIGLILPLPADDRPLPKRIAEETGSRLKQTVTASIAPFPLPDGLRSVSIIRETPFGAFSYLGFVDKSERFLIIGFRGMLTASPGKVLRDALGVSGGAHRGNAASKVEIIEVSDFQCPSCANAHAKIEPYIQKNLSKINYTRIDLPLYEHHNYAFQAAMAARALQRVAPAKYWEYVDYMFKNQEQITTRNNFEAVLREWLDDNDVSFDAVNKIYSNKTERAALLDQISRIFALGIASTPTFLVNGQIMGFGPDGQFTMDAIKNAVNSAPVATAKTPATKTPAKTPAKTTKTPAKKNG
jgi:protein-disulfide isomerase